MNIPRNNDDKSSREFTLNLLEDLGLEAKDNDSLYATDIFLPELNIFVEVEARKGRWGPGWADWPDIRIPSRKVDLINFHPDTVLFFSICPDRTQLATIPLWRAREIVTAEGTAPFYHWTGRRNKNEDMFYPILRKHYRIFSLKDGLLAQDEKTDLLSEMNSLSQRVSLL